MRGRRADPRTPPGELSEPAPTASEASGPTGERSETALTGERKRSRPRNQSMIRPMRRSAPDVNHARFGNYGDAVHTAGGAS